RAQPGTRALHDCCRDPAPPIAAAAAAKTSHERRRCSLEAQLSIGLTTIAAQRLLGGPAPGGPPMNDINPAAPGSSTRGESCNDAVLELDTAVRGPCACRHDGGSTRAVLAGSADHPRG